MNIFKCCFGAPSAKINKVYPADVRAPQTRTDATVDALRTPPAQPANEGQPITLPKTPSPIPKNNLLTRETRERDQPLAPITHPPRKQSTPTPRTGTNTPTTSTPSPRMTPVTSIKGAGYGSSNPTSTSTSTSTSTPTSPTTTKTPASPTGVDCTNKLLRAVQTSTPVIMIEGGVKNTDTSTTRTSTIKVVTKAATMERGAEDNTSRGSEREVKDAYKLVIEDM